MGGLHDAGERSDARPSEPPNKRLDTKGDLCPIPVVKTSKAIKEIGVGEVLEVVATDPASRPDLQAWSAMTGHKLLSSSEEAGPPKVYRFMIQRTR
jgi:tRNA 2-thiouridine synthesizing protein A